jgi:hypothetical protein
MTSSPTEIFQCSLRGSGEVSALTVVDSKTVVPNSRARSSNTLSKRLRLIAISAFSPKGSSTARRRPPIPMKSTRSSFPCGNARMGFATSSRRKMGQHAGLMQSPQTFSRGNFSRSKIAVRKPADAQKAAQLDPAGPAPTIATSNIAHSR